MFKACSPVDFPFLPSPRRTLRALAGCAWVLALVSCSDEAPAPAPMAAEPLFAQAFEGTQTCKISYDGLPEPELVAKPVRIVFHRRIASVVTEPDLLTTATLTDGMLSDALAKHVETDVALTVPGGVPGREIAFEAAADGAAASYGEKGSWLVSQDAEGYPMLQGDSNAWLVAKDATSSEGWTASCRWDLVPASGPRGPVGYGALDRVFASAGSPTAAGTVEQPLEGEGCGATAEKTATGLKIASFALHFVPVVGSVLGAVAHVGALSAEYIGSKKSDACLTSTLDNLNDSLANQAEKIDGIVETLGLAQNAFYHEVYTQRLTDTAQWAYIWKTNGLDKLSPTAADHGGIFGNFMTLTGLWSNLQGPAVAGVDLHQIANNDVLFSDIRAFVQSQAPDFQSTVSEITGTQVTGTCISDCYKLVAAKPSAALIHLNQSVFDALVAKMNTDLAYSHPTNAFTSTNIVPTYDTYNDTITSFFQRALVSLQQAYTLESLVNQLNYHRGAAATTPSSVTQIAGAGGIGETHYDYTKLVVNGAAPTEDAQVHAFNTAQKKLAYLYVARANQLYLNTLHYVVSDVPVGPQAYPTADVTWKYNGTTHQHAAPAYATEVGKALKAAYDRTTSKDQGPTPLSMVPSVADGPWTKRAVLYQYSGLRDVAKCLTAVQAYNQDPNQVGTLGDALAQPGACPAIFSAGDGSALSQGRYDGDTLQPYVEVDGKMVLAGAMTDNLKFCDATAPALAWFAPTGSFVGNDAGLVAGSTYLNCGRWYLPKRNEGSTTCVGMPRAHCPTSNELGADDFYQTQLNPVGTRPNVAGYPGSCAQGISLNGNGYVFSTGLFGNWPTDMRSCGTIVGSESPLSPSYYNSRAEPWSSTTLGCQIGWWGTWHVFQNSIEFNTYNHGMGYAWFGVRLPNHTNVGGAGAYSGMVLPLEVFNYVVSGTGGVGNCEVQVQLYVKRQGTFERDGYSCRELAGDKPAVRCTIKDGTQYDLRLEANNNSNSLYETFLDLQIVAP